MHNQRFFSYLSLFTFMMIILVTANNYLLMFVGWEGVGICSYLLVSFWFTRIAANQSSISAMLTNRVGDCLLTIGMFTILWSCGNIDYSTVFSLAPYINENIITMIGICLLIGAMAKSSQIGLHVWLPMAMEGWLSTALLKFHYMRERLVMCFGPLVNYVTLGKIQNKRKFAGSCAKSTISSETKRGIFTKNNLFMLWFIGFTEGDGSFIVNKNGYLEFKLTQSSVDANVLFYVKKMLGFGSVRKQDIKNGTHCYRVRDKENILKIINIFNGNLFLPARKNQFKLWIDNYNRAYKENIKCLQSKFKPTLNDTWLLGFTDAEGCFTCTVDETIPSKTSLVRLRYILSQKNTEDEMEYLAKIVNGKKHYIKSYQGYNVVVSTTKLEPVVKYFNANKLKTKKFVLYYNWLKIYNIVLTKKQYTLQGLNLVKKYKNNLNKNIHKS